MSYKKQLHKKHHQLADSFYIAGVDEVGRGCLAGPVVAAAVILPSSTQDQSWICQVTDSKALNPLERVMLSNQIHNWALSWAIGICSVKEIDQHNIFHASLLAMTRALAGLNLKPHHVLVDGKFLPKNLKTLATPVIQGDLKCLSISCASIIAKVWRDEHMKQQDVVYPYYGFAHHKGYSTPQHRQALKKYGPCIIHRQSFSPVQQMAQEMLLF